MSLHGPRCTLLSSPSCHLFSPANRPPNRYSAVCARYSRPRLHRLRLSPRFQPCLRIHVSAVPFSTYWIKVSTSSSLTIANQLSDPITSVPLDPNLEPSIPPSAGSSQQNSSVHTLQKVRHGVEQLLRMVEGCISSTPAGPPVAALNHIIQVINVRFVTSQYPAAL